MGWIARLNLAQRVVVVVTVGLTLGAVANYLTGLGTGDGWYAYSPLAVPGAFMTGSRADGQGDAAFQAGLRRRSRSRGGRMPMTRMPARISRA
jgi:hypothetical protein